MLALTDEQLEMFIAFTKTDIEEGDERERFLHVLKLAAFEELKELRKQRQDEGKYITNIEFEDDVKSEILRQYKEFLKTLPNWLQTDNWDNVVSWVNEKLDEADLTPNALIEAKESLMNRVLLHEYVLTPRIARRLNFIYLTSIITLEMKIKQLEGERHE